LVRLLDVADVRQKSIGGLHGHATEVRNEMSAGRMASNTTFAALASVLPTKGQHVTAMAAPVCTNVGDRFEAMRDTMFNLVFVALL
jgi:hypothetical protein